ncbi:hypothetical protein [Streptomyces sp. NBC_00286]|uniref:hypothetical protein n=1 Tax=Streptomyces sp. NBC_00286 TaxID=2975701 RepID=UPI002E283CFC|nr:hypothetical protein [Streptomyces sp. NBC_00286]
MVPYRFVQFVDPSYPQPALLFALIYQAISVSYVALLIVSSTYLSTQCRPDAASRLA